MKQNYTSRKAGLALAIPLAGLLAYGCTPKPVVIGPGGVPVVITPGPSPTPVSYEGARTQLFNTLAGPLQNAAPVQYSRGIAGYISRNGTLVPSAAGNERSLVVPQVGALSSDLDRTYVMTSKNGGTLDVRVYPAPDQKYFDINGIKFAYVEFKNLDVGRGDVFDGISFKIVDPYHKKNFVTEIKPGFSYHAPEETKALGTLLARHLLEKSGVPQLNVNLIRSKSSASNSGVDALIVLLEKVREEKP